MTPHRDAIFFGVQKFVLDIFGGQRGLIDCKIVLEILKKKKKRPGWGSTVGEPKSSRKSSRKQKAHITGKATQTTGAGKQHKQQRAPNSSNTRKSTERISKSSKRSSKSSTNMKNSSTNSSKVAQTTTAKAAQATAKVAQTVQTATKTARAATETRGPRRRAPKGLFVLSLASSRGISVVFLSFFFLRYR